MNFKSMVDCNITRISKLVEFHKKELADVNQKLRILRKCRTDKITLLNIEHNQWLKDKDEEIARLQRLIADKSECHQQQCDEIVEEFSQQEHSFTVRKKATMAFIREATKSDPSQEEAVYFHDPSSRVREIMNSQEDWDEVA